MALPIRARRIQSRLNQNNRQFGEDVYKRQVRVMLTFLDEDEVASRIDELAAAIFSKVPCGVGSKGALKISEAELLEVLKHGAAWAVKKGYGEREDLECIEDGGKLPHACLLYTSRCV